jgi:hypothetical protein
MIEFKAKISDISKGLFDSKTKLTLEFDGNPADFEELLNGDLRVNLKQWRDKRSLDANAYFWVLLDKLAYKLQKGKTELYRAYIKDIGGVSETVCVKTEAVEELCKGWQHNGVGWQAETRESKLKGCTNVTLYYGSSTYDTAQMSRLLDLVIQDCEEQGIPTMTPKEIEKLKERWGVEV